MSGLELIGGLLTAGASVAGGIAEKRAADFEAEQLDAKAKEEKAAAQRDAAQSRQEAELANSRAQALAASSGGGAGMDAPTIVRIMSGTAGQGEYNAQTQMYGGNSRAAGLRDQAKGRRASGRASFLGSVVGGFGKAAGSVGSYGTSKNWWG